MGQATLDLPDPSQKASLDATPSADDLLAKMANEEIDRLLGEADTERPTTAPPPDLNTDPAPTLAPAQTPPLLATENPTPNNSVAIRHRSAPRKSDPPDPDITRQLDDLFAELNTSPAATAATPPPPPTPAAQPDPQTARQLDNAPPRIDIPAPPPPPSPTLQPPPAADPVTQPAPPPAPNLAIADNAPPAIDVADQTGPIERQALTPQSADAPPPDHSTDQAAPPPNPPASDDTATLPLFVRILEWINAPVARFGDDARSLIGKVAILTLLNAVLLLLYLLIFRRH